MLTIITGVIYQPREAAGERLLRRLQNSPWEVASRSSNRRSDRKPRKRQNSTSKQIVNCHGVFSEIKLAILDF